MCLCGMESEKIRERMQLDDEYDDVNVHRKKSTLRSTRSHGSKMNVSSAHGSRKSLSQSQQSLSSQASDHNLEGMGASGGSGGAGGNSRKTPFTASTRTPRLQPFHLASSQTYASSGSGVIESIYHATVDESSKRRQSLSLKRPGNITHTLYTPWQSEDLYSLSIHSLNTHTLSMQP